MLKKQAHLSIFQKATERFCYSLNCIYIFFRFLRVMWFHYALNIKRASILPLDSEEVGKGDAEASFFLSTGE